MSPSSPPPPREIAVGDVLDRYTIVRHVARGGMGSVWLARFEGKHGFAKDVAVKTILPELASDAQFRAMFLEEARISSKLAHANVAQVLDVGEHAGTVYIVFEWVEGRSLEQLCDAAAADGGRVPLPLLLRVLADACAGLHAAHELAGDDGAPLGVVHRDVTPANILVSGRGFAKVIDFGIAKAKGRVSGETKSGLVKGTPQYMSPEAAFRRPLDRRADVWSLGAVMHRALTGKPPFADLQALLDVLDGVTRLAELPSDVPTSVRDVVKRAMSFDPTRRFESAEAMRRALERCLYETHAPPETIASAASQLATGRDVPDAHASTHVALVSPAPAKALPAPEPAAVTQASPGVARAARPVPDPVRALTIVVIVAAIVTGIAAALAFSS